MSVCAAASDGGRKKSPYLSKQDLSSCRAWLLELMQDINFGRIEQMLIRNGDPVRDPRPVVVREVKFGGKNGPHPEFGANDFLLKQKVVELFAFFDRLQNGLIDAIEIQDGLPFRMIVREVPA